MKRLICILTILATLFTLCMPIVALDVPDSIDGYYLDDADVLSAETEDYITEKNSLMDDHCGGYIEVVTQPYIRADVADYSYALFNEWQIGGSRNNGILLVLVPEEDTYYLMYGTGLESEVPVYEFQNIIDTYFADAFDAGQYDKAVRDTFDALYRVLENTYGSPTVPTTSPRPVEDDNSGMVGIIFVIVILVIAIVLISSLRSVTRGPRGWTAPRRRSYRGYRPRPYRTTRRSWRPSSYEHSYRGHRSSHSSRSSFGSRSSSHRSSSSRSSGRSSFGGVARSARSSGGRSRGSGVGRR